MEAPDSILARSLEKAAARIREADAVLIAAGAGMGVDSGLPDYRGANGIYNAYAPFARLGADYMKITRPSHFLRDPALAWGFWGYQMNLYRTTPPHEGVALLHEICRRLPNNHFVQTTNVEGHFTKAGFDPLRIHECHGSVCRFQCLHPCCRELWPADPVAIDPETMRARAPLPTCPHCGGLARPNVFMFGDTAYVWDHSAGQADRYRAWLDRQRGRRLVIIECGAGTVSPGLRNHGEQLIREHAGATLIRINPSEADVPAGPDFIRIPSGALQAIREIAGLLP